MSLFITSDAYTVQQEQQAQANYIIIKAFINACEPERFVCENVGELETLCLDVRLKLAVEAAATAAVAKAEDQNDVQLSAPSNIQLERIQDTCRTLQDSPTPG